MEKVLDNSKINDNENKEKYSVKNIHWKCKDVIRNLKGEIIEIIESSNIIVKDCSKLIAGLVGGKLTSGASYWAVGSGNSAWDVAWGTNDPVPVDSAVKLIAEIGRKAIVPSTDVIYVDVNGNPAGAGVITNRIKITVTFGANDANGDWREFGLFGGNATSSVNTGIMIDHKYHKIIFKTPSITVTRSIILEF